MKANDFLKIVVRSLGLQLGPDDELLVMMPNKDGDYESEPVLSKSGYPFVLPTNSNLNRLVKVNKDGKLDLEYFPFNPIVEDDISRETDSFKMYLKRIQVMLTLETYETGMMLINIAKNDNLVDTKGIRVEKFLTNLGKHITTKNMKIVDETTMKNYVELFRSCKEPENKKLVHIVVKKRGEIDGKIYPVVTSIYFPLVEEIMQLSSSEDAIVNDVKLRKKDIAVFQEVFRALFPMINSEFIYRVASERDDYPLFDSTYRMYLEIAIKHGEISKKLNDIRNDDFDPVGFELEIRPDDIGDILNSITKELSRIPTERSLLSPKEREESEEIKPVNLPKTNIQRQEPQHQPVQQFQQQYVPVNSMGQPMMGYNVLNPNMGMTNGVYPYAVTNNGFVQGSVLDTINSAMNPYQQPPMGNMGQPYNPLNMSGQGFMVSTVPSTYNCFEKKPLGLTGESDFQ